MRTYGQYCPIARSAELLGERWTLIIVRNILIGCRTFNDIAAGAPGLSRGLLSKRLRELERAGVITITSKSAGQGSVYAPTEAGRELWDVMLAMQHWGARWAELSPEHAHPGIVLWTWVRKYLRREGLPSVRTLVRFDFPTEPIGGRHAWLLFERGDVELCDQHPGGDEAAVVVVRDPLVFARWHLGDIEWAAALRSGALEFMGSRRIQRALPTWHIPARPTPRQVMMAPA